MHPLTKVLAIGLILTLFGWFWTNKPSVPVIPTQAMASSSMDEGSGTSSNKMLGQASCIGCHGKEVMAEQDKNQRGQGQPKTWEASYTHWINHDKHGNAYRTLQTPKSERIYAALKQGDPTVWNKDKPWEHELCLSCHSTPTIASDKVSENEIGLRVEGVSCEACHGNASSWIVTHTSNSFGEQAKNNTTKKKACEDCGLTFLETQSARARMCVGCHIGAPAEPEKGIPTRDMNHDVIAAGHPRLNFEYALYQRAMPPHWYEHECPDQLAANSPAKDPALQFRAWMVGRVAQAEGQINLLKDRMKRSTSSGAYGPWPEFSEYNCYACHHGLEPESWRQDPSRDFYKGRTPGALVWNKPWGLADDLNKQLDTITTLMQGPTPKDGVPTPWKIPGAKKVQGGLLNIDFDAIYAQLENAPAMPFASAEILAEMKKRWPNEDALKRLNWDDASQIYNMFLSAQHALARQNQATKWVEQLPAWKMMLQLEREPEHFDSPVKYRPEQVKDLLNKLQDVMK